MSRLKRAKNWKKRIINNTGKRFINGMGCIAAKWILHNCEDGLVIIRKGGAKQIIKVFAEPAYKNIIKPAIFKATDQIKVGDVVTDDGYCAKPRKPGGKYTCYIFRGKLDAFLGKRELDPGDSEEKHEKKS